jgi:hypothetical protein
VNVVRIKLRACFQEIIHSHHYKDPHMWRFWFFSYWLKCTIIHFQRRSMILNFNYGMGSSHFLRILILSLWLWVISIMWSMFHGSPKKKKNLVKKKLTTNNFRAKSFKKWLKKMIIFIIVSAIILWEKPLKILPNFTFQKISNMNKISHMNDWEFLWSQAQAL